MSAKIQIDRDIPIPGPKGGDGVIPVCRRLEIGESFLIPSDIKSRSVMAAQANKLLPGKRFVGRKTPDGHRIWRVS